VEVEVYWRAQQGHCLGLFGLFKPCIVTLHILEEQNLRSYTVISDTRAYGKCHFFTKFLDRL